MCFDSFERGPDRTPPDAINLSFVELRDAVKPATKSVLSPTRAIESLQYWTIECISSWPKSPNFLFKFFHLD
jgi:hypothetical protein